MPENWSLSETQFNPRQLRSQETIFTIGNGSVCTRGAYEESYPGETPATLAAGLYDDIPTYQSELVNIPNWLWLQVWVDGEPFRMDLGDLLYYQRALDLHTGCLTRQIRWRSPARKTLELEWERWISLADPHALGIRIKVRSLDFSGRVELRAGLDGRVDNVGTRHWDLQDQGPLNNNGGFLHLRTKSTQIEICQAFRLAVRAGGPSLTYVPEDSQWTPGVRVLTEIHTGQVLTVDKLVSIYCSRGGCGRDETNPVLDLVQETNSHLESLATQGYDRLREESAAAWAKEWYDCSVTIEGDPEAERAVRFSLYQLLIAAPRHVPQGSIGARGLSGFEYHGHIFWDAEFYMLPFFLFTRPDIARRMLLYRYFTLSGARAKAQEKGWEGSMFAWESAATGEEATPRWVPEPNGVELERIWSGDLSLFTTAGIAWAVDQYWQVTGDDSFLRDFGAEIILDTACFWGKRAEWCPQADCYQLTNVIGPDEFHLHVNNNAFTNHLVHRDLEIALKVWDWLCRSVPEKARELEARLCLTSDHFQKWKHISERIIPASIDRHTGLIEQFDGYFKLLGINLADYEPRLQSIQVILGLQRSQQIQITRQPDVLLLLFLFKDIVDRAGILANWRYYAPRTDLSHGSSLGYSIHAALAAQIGEVESAYRDFRAAAAADLEDRFGNTANGIHAGNAGGIWQALVMGFAGLELGEEEGYVLHPHLPSHWKKLSFSVYLRGKRRRIEIQNSTDPAQIPIGSAPTDHLPDRVHPQEHGIPGLLLDSLPSMAYRGLSDPGRTMMSVDAYCFNLTGLHPAELVGRQLYGSLIHPYDRDYVFSVLHQAQREKRGYSFVYRIITAAYREKWVLEDGRTLAGEDSNFQTYLEGRIIELTGRSTEYDALSEYAERLESLREIDQAILAARSSAEVVHIALRALRRLAPPVRLNLVLLDLATRQAEVFSVQERSLEVTKSIISVTPELGRWWSSSGVASAQERVSISQDEFSQYLDPQGREIANRLGVYNQLVPLRSQRTLVGILALGTDKPEALADAPIGIASELANSLAIAITQRRLSEQVNTAHQNLQSLSRRLVDVQEQERRALARELHDEIGQALTAIKINLESLKNSSAATSPKRLEDSIQIVSQTLQQVRNLSLDLRPALLDELGLAATLRWYVDRIAQWNGIEAQFQASLRQERLPAEIETTLFRVSQEALTNVIRHSGARRVALLLDQTSERIILQIRDNGRGFKVNEALQAAVRGNSLGLLSIQERLNLIGGRLKIHSSLGMGSEISAEVPYLEE